MNNEHHNSSCNHKHEHHHDHGHDHGHDHSHGGKTAIVLFFVGLISFLVALFISNQALAVILNLIAMVTAGYHIIIEGIMDTIYQTRIRRTFTPNIHLLMLIAALGAVVIKEYHEAALLILIFAGAHFLEEYAENRSKQEITGLLRLNPVTARRIKSDGTIEITAVSDLHIGDCLRVLNGDQVPTDGIVLEGFSSIDQSAITGESIPVEVGAGDAVFGSTMNGNGAFDMEVTKDAGETVFAKIIALVSQTQSNVSRTAAFIKRIEPAYVTAVLLLSPVFYLMGLYVFNWGSSESFYRTMVFLIGASPCALAATDIPATLSAISNLAKRGVLFKGGSYLSNLTDIRAIAFDKTGTLTQGQPVVTDVSFDSRFDEEKQKRFADIIYSMEKKSNHPLARAITRYFSGRNELNVAVDNIVGVGLKATSDNECYLIAKPSQYKHLNNNIISHTETYEQEGKTVIYFGTENEVYGLLAVQDIPKLTTKEAVEYFQHENIHTVMITGDAVKTGQAIGNQLGIDEVRGNVLPDSKSDIIKELKNRYGVVAMVGDGVNDAPALVASDIGFAMGDGTDIAIDVADAVIMKNDLNKIVYTHKISKRLRSVVWQNIIFAFAVVLLLVVLNVLGLMNMSYAVLIHEGSTLVVIVNGLRLLKQIR